MFTYYKSNVRKSCRKWFSLRKSCDVAIDKTNTTLESKQKSRKLINMLDPKKLEAKLNAETFLRKTVSFYRYVKIEEPLSFRNKLWKEWNELQVLGRIYVAPEGVNAQLSVPRHNFELFTRTLQRSNELENIPLKYAVEDTGKSFKKLKIKVRSKIVADGLSPQEYNVTDVGQRLNAREWNKAMDDGAVVVDMRNHFEVVVHEDFDLR